MPAFPRFSALTRDLPATVPFVGPEAIERNRRLRVKARIGANESGFGPAPSVKAAMIAAIDETWKYTDPENFDLREAIASHHGIRGDQVNVGAGVDGLLGEIVRLVIEPGMPVVTSHGGYPTFNYHVVGFGGRLVTVAYRNDHEDLEGLLDAVKREDAPLVYFANPDNPMGSAIGSEAVLAFARAIPETTMLILDEAYGETAPAGIIPPAAALLDRPNVVRTRTFSKAYGLAGSRIAYVIAHEDTAKAFDKIRNHFGLNRIGVAAALAALADQAYLKDVVGRIAAARNRIGAIARSNNLDPLPSATNFVAIDCGRDGAYARAIVDGLMEEGVFIRMPGVAPLNRCIRVSAGLDKDLDLFEEALPKVLKRLGNVGE
jgi:histidinol-phosphate aminotransferase